VTKPQATQLKKHNGLRFLLLKGEIADIPGRLGHCFNNALMETLLIV